LWLNRYVSKRSKDEDGHRRHSSHYSHSKEDRSNHSMKNEQSRHRRDPHSVDKYQSQEIEGNTGRCSKNGKESHRRLHEERYRSDHSGGERDGVEIRSRRHRSDQRGCLEPRSSDRHSDYTVADLSKSPSGSRSTSRYDDHKRRRKESSEDHNPEKHYSSVHKSKGEEHGTKRYSSCYTEDDYYDKKSNGRGKSGKGKSHHDDSDDRWVATNSDIDSDFERYQRSSSKRSKTRRKDEVHSDAEAQSERSGMEAKDHKSRRGKCHGEHRQYGDTSYSDTTDSSSDSEENVSKQWSRRKIDQKQSSYSKYKQYT
jgi:U2 small nuclear ribonucleoprotein auxiliary factor 35 kDa subunit-related protein